MQTKTSLRGIKERIILHRLLGISCASLAVFLFGFVLIPTLRAEASATSLTSANINWAPVSLTLDPDYGNGSISDAGHGDINFGEIIPTANSGNNYGTLKVVKKTIAITSNGQYYTVYLSMASSNDDNNPNTADLTLRVGNGSDSAVTIPAISSAFSAPAKFSGTAWGYAVPGVEDTGIDSAPTGANAFVAPVLLDTQINYTSTFEGAANTYNNTKWAGVPAEDVAPQQIWKAHASGANAVYGFGTYTTVNNVEVTGDTVNNKFDIYYGLAVDTNTLAGTYENVVVYTALASASDLDDVSTNLVRDKIFGGSGEIETIKFDLAESASLIAEDDITIVMVPHDDLYSDDGDDTNDYLIDELDMADYDECEVVANSLVISDHAEIRCVIPDTLAIEDGTGVGGYDFWLNIDNYDYNYLSHAEYEDEIVAAFYYAGLQSIYPTTENTTRAGSSIVTEMQEMAGGICRNTNMWGSKTGNDARIYDYLGEQKSVIVDPETEEETTVYNGNALLAAGVDTLGISTFNLVDNRDENSYIVRRLADGECWMVSNLRLNLADFAGTRSLTKSNTDIETDYWDPAEYTMDWARTQVEAAGDETEVTLENYFEIATKYSTAYPTIQHHQFQPDGVLGTMYAGTDDETTYTWPTYVDPREYLSNSFGGYYNFSASALGSPSAIEGYLDYPNSICPKGWRLPHIRMIPGSYRYLIKSAYALMESDSITDASVRRAIFSRPISIDAGGYYNNEAGTLEKVGLHTNYATSETNSSRSHRLLVMTNVESVALNGGYNERRGVNVRCVSRD